MAVPIPPKYSDILLIGSGSAALSAACYLSRTSLPPDLKISILEQRASPLKHGRADGVQCRTVEIYESLGLSERVLSEAHWLLEICFWSFGDESGTTGDGDGKEREKDAEEKRKGIKRQRRAADTQPGLSHMPHVILNQARMNQILIDDMEAKSDIRVAYGWEVKSVSVDEGGRKKDGEKTTNGEDITVTYPVHVVAKKDGIEHVFRARYVLACDGAHSTVRKSLNIKMLGDTSDAIWGVLDIYALTNFPDIRKKTTIHSTSGNLLIIPREGGQLVRFYVELPAGTKAKEVQLEMLIEKAREIFWPYTLEVQETVWWSVYCIGQRLAERFHESYRVFLTGDACHTHSPKAGQGMNVSLQDGYNIAWKLASVLKGEAKTEILETYVSERQEVAANLIDFDRYFMKIWASKSRDEGFTPKEFSDAFIKAGTFTAGFTSQYRDSMITAATKSDSALAKKLIVGMRLPSTPMVRFCDAKVMHLARGMLADGRWRILVFVGDITEPAAADKLQKLATYLDSPAGPLRSYTSPPKDITSIIEPILLLSGDRLSIEQEQIPDIFWPPCSPFGIRNLEKVFVDDKSYHTEHCKAYEFYGVDADRGAVVIVRPDFHVAAILSLDDHEMISGFFAGFLIKRADKMEDRVQNSR